MPTARGLKTPAEWTAAIPSPVTARQALDLIKGALQDAENDILEYKGRGTVPPPPWPIHPELRRAIDALDGGRLQLEAALSIGMGDRSAKRGEPRWEQLSKGGAELYKQLAVMDANMAKGIDLPAVAKAAAKLNPFGALGTLTSGTLILVAIAALVWFEGRRGGRAAWG